MGHRPEVPDWARGGRRFNSSRAGSDPARPATGMGHGSAPRCAVSGDDAIRGAFHELHAVRPAGTRRFHRPRPIYDLNVLGYLDNPDVELVALVDQLPERRDERAADWPEAKTFASAAELAASGLEVDAVEVLLPTPFHDEASSSCSATAGT